VRLLHVCRFVSYFILKNVGTMYRDWNIFHCLYMRWKTFCIDVFVWRSITICTRFCVR
jgi:hypothetical protein